MSPVDIGSDRREFIIERIADEALGRQVVTFVGVHLLNHLNQVCIVFQPTGVQRYLISEVADPPEVVLRMFRSHSPDDAMNFIAFV
jgi:hypothetical protein